MTVKLPHSNSSKRKKKFTPDAEIEALARRVLSDDYIIWDTLVSAGDVLHGCYSLKTDIQQD